MISHPKFVFINNMKCKAQSVVPNIESKSILNVGAYTALSFMLYFANPAVQILLLKDKQASTAI